MNHNTLLFLILIVCSMMGLGLKGAAEQQVENGLLTLDQQGYAQELAIAIISNDVQQVENFLKLALPLFLISDGRIPREVAVINAFEKLVKARLSNELVKRNHPGEQNYYLQNKAGKHFAKLIASRIDLYKKPSKREDYLPREQLLTKYRNLPWWCSRA